METATSKELLYKLKNLDTKGLEVSATMGILAVTKAIYFRENHIFIFPMEDDFIFEKDYGITEDEFLGKYPNSKWKIEQVIG